MATIQALLSGYIRGALVTYSILLPSNLVTMYGLYAATGRAPSSTDMSLLTGVGFIASMMRSMRYAAQWPAIPWFVLRKGKNPLVFDLSDL